MEVTSCLVNTVPGSKVLGMTANRILVLCQLKQAKEHSASSRTQKQAVARRGEDVIDWWPASLPDSRIPGTLQPDQALLLTQSSKMVQQPPAQKLPLHILLAVDIVKIPSDVPGKICRTWLILDSSF